MLTRYQTRTNLRAQAASSVFPTRGLLQRRCACGAAPGVSGECAECRENRLRRHEIKADDSISTGNPRVGHDLGSLQIHSPNFPGGGRELFMNGPGDTSKPVPPSAPVKKDPAPPVKAASKCPTDIRVANVGPATDRDFGKNGFLTGWGGLSQMEVSDASGKNWDGTAIQESFKRIKNSCGDRGKNACSNVSSDQEKSTAGSTFTVGAESNFLGKAKLAAAQNRFYDLHVFASKDASLLHELKKDSCEVQCQQSYSCGGKRFGPDFIITYTMTRDVVQSGAKNINVTRVGITKTPKAADAAKANP